MVQVAVDFGVGTGTELQVQCKALLHILPVKQSLTTVISEVRVVQVAVLHLSASTEGSIVPS